MRITKVSVTGLFGIFNHRVSLNDEGITILHGPNGVGKTSVLRLIHAAFSDDLPYLWRTPFEKLELEFADSSVFRISKIREELPKRQVGSDIRPADYAFRYDWKPKSQKPQTHTESSRRLERRNPIPSRYIERHLPNLERVEPRVWYDAESGQHLSLSAVLMLFGNQLQFDTDDIAYAERPTWLVDLLKANPVHLIQTQRLLTVDNPRVGVQRERAGSHPARVVEAYSVDLSRRIRDTLAQSATLAQNLDRSFPNRLLSASLPVNLNEQILRAEYETQIRHRSNLIESGLLDQSPGEVDLPERQLDNTELKVLWLYLEDVRKKLAVFSDLSARIELLKSLVNNRFILKNLSVSEDDGLVFRTGISNRIPLRTLSSGEQHEVVLLYELLFKVAPDSLILIDEPELSLHVAWQKVFLDDLSRVRELTNIDFVIATHSPQIINDRWDLTEQLEFAQTT